MKQTVTPAITGASGAQYGLRLLQCLVAAGVDVFCLMSRVAQVVINTETALSLPESHEQIEQTLITKANARPEQLRLLKQDDWMSSVASGSGAPTKMVVCPCSSGTLSAIACGSSNNLIGRAADVALKERRRLILVHREAPLSEIHLENMLKLTRKGAVILQASPGFYYQPETVDDMIDFVVARVLQQLEPEHNLMPQWGRDTQH